MVVKRGTYCKTCKASGFFTGFVRDFINAIESRRDTKNGQPRTKTNKQKTKTKGEKQHRKLKR